MSSGLVEDTSERSNAGAFHSFTNVPSERCPWIVDAPIVIWKEAIDFATACARRPSVRDRKQLFDSIQLPLLPSDARSAIFAVIVLGH